MANTELSRLLRELRRTTWPGHVVTQKRVAEALGVTAPSISAYENGTVPPPDRLRDYAAFFAYTRLLDRDAPRRVTYDDLQPNEREIFDMLAAQFEAAAGVATDPVSSTAATPFWRFPDDAPIRIFCGLLEPQDAGPHSDPSDHNYMRLGRAADLDSLFELWGNVRRLNPDSDVRFVLGDDFTDEDLGSHMVVLGNIAQAQGSGRLIPDKSLPVRQVDVPGWDGELFEGEQETIPQLEPQFDADNKVVEDVGLIARRPNPHHPGRSLTVCSGVFTRGVYGAVRSLSDSRYRDENVGFLREAVDPSSFAVLIRVRVVGDNVVTPYLPDAILHTFSPIDS